MSSGQQLGSEAQYNGEYFDSRTEAAWATYFQQAGMDYTREPETFEFDYLYGSKQIPVKDIYTPDFLLPDQDLYVEVKNGLSVMPSVKKLILLAQCTGKACLLVEGKPQNASLYFYSPKPWRSIEERKNDNPMFPDVWAPRFKWLPVSDASALADSIRQQFTDSENIFSTDVDPEVREASKLRKEQLFRDKRRFSNYLPH
ncbi:MAG: hypothetical protein WCJ24_03285 [Candidatus Saccharibacteria bacterium]